MADLIKDRAEKNIGWVEFAKSTVNDQLNNPEDSILYVHSAASVVAEYKADKLAFKAIEELTQADKSVKFIAKALSDPYASVGIAITINFAKEGEDDSPWRAIIPGTAGGLAGYYVAAKAAPLLTAAFAAVGVNLLQKQNQHCH